jgi:hypothetical protein
MTATGETSQFFILLRIFSVFVRFEDWRFECSGMLGHVRSCRLENIFDVSESRVAFILWTMLQPRDEYSMVLRNGPTSQKTESCSVLAICHKTAVRNIHNNYRICVSVSYLINFCFCLLTSMQLDVTVMPVHVSPSLFISHRQY